MSKIKLANGDVYAVADYASQNSFVILLGGMSASEVLESMTEENLSAIQFVTDGGEVTGEYKNKLLCDSTVNGDTLAVNINDADLCRYGLTLDENSRIVSATAQRYAPKGATIVDELPDGDIHDYLYVDGKFIYDPMPIPDEPDPHPTQEERITALEVENAQLKEALDLLLSGATEEADADG